MRRDRNIEKERREGDRGWEGNRRTETESWNWRRGKHRDRRTDLENDDSRNCAASIIKTFVGALKALYIAVQSLRNYFAEHLFDSPDELDGTLISSNSDTRSKEFVGRVDPCCQQFLIKLDSWFWINKICRQPCICNIMHTGLLQSDRKGRWKPRDVYFMYKFL